MAVRHHGESIRWVRPSLVIEVEFAAWDRSGRKLWSRFVEPPWDFRVVEDRIRLDVMGQVTEFPMPGP